MGLSAGDTAFVMPVFGWHSLGGSREAEGQQQQQQRRQRQQQQQQQQQQRRRRRRQQQWRR
jgi:hypothetical protein